MGVKNSIAIAKMLNDVLPAEDEPGAEDGAEPPATEESQHE